METKSTCTYMYIVRGIQTKRECGEGEERERWARKPEKMREKRV